MLNPIESWPPDYTGILNWRARTIADFRGPDSEKFRAGAYRFYGEKDGGDPVQFVEDWVDTFDPRNATKGLLTRMPFVLFKRQRRVVCRRS
jgi:hypothetical protein